MSAEVPSGGAACERLTLQDLVDYTAGELPETEAASVEEHLFTCAGCAARAADLDGLVHGMRMAAAAGDVVGFVTDDVLNRLARDGVRVRSFTLEPGAVVPCAVWEGDDVMVLRLRSDFGNAMEVTISRRVPGGEVSRVTGPLVRPASGEVLFADPADRIRALPSVAVEISLTAHDGDRERVVGTYTLLHGGSLDRR